jgi:hypothetical protein
MENMDNQNIEEFWNWFERHKDEEPTALISSVNERLKQVSFGLSAELSVSKNPRELILTPQGIKQFFTDAYALVEQAPIIDGWKLVPTKQASSVEHEFKMGNVKISPSEVTFMPLNADEHPEDVAIRLYHKDYVPEEGEQQNAVITGLYLLLDNLLGEESSTFDFQYIDFDDMPHPKEKDYPLSELASFVQHKKSIRKISGQKFPKEDITLLEGKVEDLPTLLVINQGLKYYEFTKDFPFLFRLTLELRNAGENGLPTGNTDEIYTVEDVIYKEIYKEEKGHFLATETYNGKRELFYYVDSEESIENALALLPKELTTCKLSHEVNFDPFWVMTESYIYM